MVEGGELNISAFESYFLLKIGSLENRNKIKELDTEQLLVPYCEVQAIHLNTWGNRLLY